MVQHVSRDLMLLAALALLLLLLLPAETSAEPGGRGRGSQAGQQDGGGKQDRENM